jgi:hypothetical protein
MKIAWVSYNLLTCGGIITLFEYVQELRKRGYKANIYADEGNNDLESFYNIHHLPTAELINLNDEDILIAVRWEQCKDLMRFKGRKIQFVQGNDRYYYESCNHEDTQKMIDTRNDNKWELIGVSEYALKDWGRGTVIENGIADRFFVNYNLERDIDALVEGNNETNKNIDFAIAQARYHGHKKIVWLGRDTREILGIETITNPPQEEIPKIYQRAKHFYKYSKSEGFCLPILEALLSGCIVHTHDMGHNFPELTKEYATQFTWKKSVDLLLNYLKI